MQTQFSSEVVAFAKRACVCVCVSVLRLARVLARTVAREPKRAGRICEGCVCDYRGHESSPTRDPNVQPGRLASVFRVPLYPFAPLGGASGRGLPIASQVGSQQYHVQVDSAICPVKLHVVHKHVDGMKPPNKSEGLPRTN
eukprot:969609-Amphidinium_carterae.1